MQVELSKDSTFITAFTNTVPNGIERDFQTYFNVLLHRHADGTYSIPEWDDYFNWGHPRLTLFQVQNLMMQCQNLLTLFPSLGSFAEFTTVNQKMQ